MALTRIREEHTREHAHMRYWSTLPNNDLPSSATTINFYTEDMRNLTLDIGFYLKTYNDIPLIFKPPKDPPESE